MFTAIRPPAVRPRRCRSPQHSRSGRALAVGMCATEASAGTFGSRGKGSPRGRQKLDHVVEPRSQSFSEDRRELPAKFTISGSTRSTSATGCRGFESVTTGKAGVMLQNQWKLGSVIFVCTAATTLAVAPLAAAGGAAGCVDPYGTGCAAPAAGCVCGSGRGRRDPGRSCRACRRRGRDPGRTGRSRRTRRCRRHYSGWTRWRGRTGRRCGRDTRRSRRRRPDRAALRAASRASAAPAFPHRSARRASSVPRVRSEPDSFQAIRHGDRFPTERGGSFGQFLIGRFGIEMGRRFSSAWSLGCSCAKRNLEPVCADSRTCCCGGHHPDAVDSGPQPAAAPAGDRPGAVRVGHSGGDHAAVVAPAVLSTSLATGSRRLAGLKVLVKRLLH